MNAEFKSIMRREAIRTWLLLFVLMATGVALVSGIRHFFQLRIPPFAQGLLVLLPSALFFLWPRRLTPSDLHLLPLAEFLTTPEALFAPNQQEYSSQIAAWLSSFASRHSNAVLVGIQPDEPHLTDVVFLFGKLLPSETTRVTQFGADVFSVSLNVFNQRFPAVRPPKLPIHELIWD